MGKVLLPEGCLSVTAQLGYDRTSNRTDPDRKAERSQVQLLSGHLLKKPAQGQEISGSDAYEQYWSIVTVLEEFAMNPAQFFEKIQALPPDKQAEVFDFIEFLASRSIIPGDREIAEDKGIAEDEWTNADFSQMAMSQAMRDMEEEPSLYTLDDLKERWR